MIPGQLGHIDLYTAIFPFRKIGEIGLKVFNETVVSVYSLTILSCFSVIINSYKNNNLD